MENSVDVITCHLKFSFDICCSTETIFVRFIRLTPPEIRWLRRLKDKTYKEKNFIRFQKLNGLLKLGIRRLNSLFAQKLLSCKQTSGMWKLFKELTGDRHIRSNNQVSICYLIKYFVRQSSDIMLPIFTGLRNSCVPIFTEADVRKCLQSINLS